MTGWARRFESFVARKEREAREATLFPFTTAVDADGEGFERIGNEWSSRLFDGPFYLSPPTPTLGGAVPAVSLVFVQSLEGNTVASDPSTLGGGATDKHLIYEGLSRVKADAVLAGAETVRGSDLIFSVWHPEMVRLRAELRRPRHPVQLVATLRGMALDEELIFNVPDLRVVILTLADAADRMRDALAARPWIATIEMKHPTDVREALSDLRRAGIDYVSAIGGRTVARVLVSAMVVRDLYLTASAISAGERNTPLFAATINSRTVVKKHGTGDEAGIVFEHLGLG